MATIYDVARAAGVSPKTVSRVLNGDAPVKKHTRDAINAAMAEMGYVPSSAARSMRSNKSGLVGLITGAISTKPEPLDPQGLPDLFIVQGIQRVMATSGKTLMIADTGGRFDKVAPLINTFLQHRVEGLIYVAEYHQRVDLPPVPTGHPMVLVNCFDDLGTPAVLPDDRRCQRDLVAQVIQSGHRRIGHLTLIKTHAATGQRIDGYKDALTEAAIPFDPALVVTAYSDGRIQDSQFLWDAIDQLLTLPQPPTVLCCGNDEMALRVYGILRTRGIKVPEDISVAGFDNYRVIAETLYPPLSTVVLPYADMGAQAADLLLTLIQGDTEIRTTPMLVSGPVCWRDSVTTVTTTKSSFTLLQSKGRKT
jgi:LacI family transcriptional regulator